MAEIIELLGSTKNKMNKDKKAENVPHLIVILLTAIISKTQESCIRLFLINHLVNY